VSRTLANGENVSGIRIAIAGVGNCASSLLQGIEHYRAKGGRPAAGLLHPSIGGYGVEDVRVVAAFDVDRRKVGRPLEEAAFAPPNCTKRFHPRLPHYGVVVQMGPVLDGVAEHMLAHPAHRSFRPADGPACDVAAVLADAGADVLLCYVPVGSELAAQHYALACLEAGVALVNCMPAFIASDPEWGKRFEERNIPVIGDDVKSQVGATIVHRVLARLLQERGVRLERTYQLNTGGNTDFLNMLERHRLKTKKISKTEAVQSQLEVPLEPDRIHVGPSDYVPWQEDNKVCFLRLEWLGFGDVPMNLEARLSVEDSPNSAGIVIDALRCAKLARDRGLAGPLVIPSAVAMKHPPVQLTDAEAHALFERWLVAEPAELPVDRDAPAALEPQSGNGHAGRVLVLPRSGAALRRRRRSGRLGRRRAEDGGSRVE
jgi:myo-inositol-1-phosphate synthase